VNLGDFELHLLIAGGWRPDGGTFFGVIPKGTLGAEEAR